MDVDVKDVLAGQLVVLPDGRAGCVEGVLDCLSRPADTTEELGIECPGKVVQVAEVRRVTTSMCPSFIGR